MDLPIGTDARRSYPFDIRLNIDGLTVITGADKAEHLLFSSWVAHRARIFSTDVSLVVHRGVVMPTFTGYPSRPLVIEVDDEMDVAKVLRQADPDDVVVLDGVDPRSDDVLVAVARGINVVVFGVETPQPLCKAASRSVTLDGGGRATIRQDDGSEVAVNLYGFASIAR